MLGSPPSTGDRSSHAATHRPGRGTTHFDPGRRPRWGWSGPTACRRESGWGIHRHLPGRRTSDVGDALPHAPALRAPGGPTGCTARRGNGIRPLPPGAARGRQAHGAAPAGGQPRRERDRRPPTGRTRNTGTCRAARAKSGSDSPVGRGRPGQRLPRHSRRRRSTGALSAGSTSTRRTGLRPRPSTARPRAARTSASHSEPEIVDTRYRPPSYRVTRTGLATTRPPRQPRTRSVVRPFPRSWRTIPATVPIPPRSRRSDPPAGTRARRHQPGTTASRRVATNAPIGRLPPPPGHGQPGRGHPALAEDRVPAPPRTTGPQDLPAVVAPKPTRAGWSRRSAVPRWSAGR